MCALRWLHSQEGCEGGSEVRSNGLKQASVSELISGALRQLRADEWAFRTLYEPSAILRSMGLRGFKYFSATSVSSYVLYRALGKRLGRTAHLHRHSMITCHLDALVDQSCDLEWAMAFGNAVFGITCGMPAFRPLHTDEFRAAIESDYPLLRLAVEGPYKAEIVESLLQAAAVELEKRRLNPFEYKVLSNLVCIRPFLAEHFPDDSMEALAVCFTFCDDAFDVLEDLEQGQPPYMACDADVEETASVARKACSKLNEMAAADFSHLAEAGIELCKQAALAQINSPENYRAIETSAPGVCVCLFLTLFAAYGSTTRAV
jgi:hypothetical protein